MYRYLIRPFLFAFPPESVHYAVVFSLRVLFSIPFVKSIFKVCFAVRSPKLERRLGSLVFPNPVGLAGGFDKNATACGLMEAFGFGFIEVGTVTPLAQPGNPQPRLFRLPADRALINRMGFNNKGAGYASKQLQNRPCKVPVAGNIGKNTATSLADAAADYLSCCQQLYPYVDFFVVNVSCPNIGNLTELQDGDALPGILLPLTQFAATQTIRKPFFLKIGPDLTDQQIDKVVNVVYACKFDGIVAVNTTTSREGLATSPEELSQIGRGGLSGAVLLPGALRTINYIAKLTNGKMPIIGVGGIMDAASALRMIDAGAWLVEVYTGFIYEGPAIARRINKALLARLDN